MDLTWNQGTVDNINTSIRRNYDKQLARILAEKTRRFAKEMQGKLFIQMFHHLSGGHGTFVSFPAADTFLTNTGA